MNRKEKKRIGQEESKIEIALTAHNRPGALARTLIEFSHGATLAFLGHAFRYADEHGLLEDHDQ